MAFKSSKFGEAQDEKIKFDVQRTADRLPDFVLDSTLGEEGLHAVPGCVLYAHQPKDTLEHVSDWRRRCSKRTDFGQRVGTYASHRLGSLLY